jgi:hypothetical protein
MLRIISVSLLLLGCSAKGGSLNLRYKQIQPLQFFNSKMEPCIQSGDIQTFDEGGMKIRYFYENCEMYIIRYLQPHELKHWGIQK